MSMFAETIAAEHEYRHKPDEDPAYNESTYYNVACPSSGVIGWLRIGIQANQPAAQATVLLFLPTGETLFSFQRVGAVPDDELTAGGIRIEVVEPLQEQVLHFDGTVSVLADARALTDPRSALRSAPSEPMTLGLRSTALGDPFGTNGETESNFVEATMALGHYEQFARNTGVLTVGDRSFSIDGVGVRDHSWGPRDWAGPSCYRWATAALDDGSALMAMEVTQRSGDVTRHGASYATGASSELELRGMSVPIWTDDGFGKQVRSDFTGPDGQPLELIGTAPNDKQFAPLRHRRAGDDGQELVTRIGYAPYTFRTSDGRTGTGIVEMLDQMIDGRPIGMTRQL